MKSPTFLQDKLREYFLENKHHMTLVMTPDVSEVVEAANHVHGIEHVTYHQPNEALYATIVHTLKLFTAILFMHSYNYRCVCVVSLLAF